MVPRQLPVEHGTGRRLWQKLAEALLKLNESAGCAFLCGLGRARLLTAELAGDKDGNDVAAGRRRQCTDQRQSCQC